MSEITKALAEAIKSLALLRLDLEKATERFKSFKLNNQEYVMLEGTHKEYRKDAQKADEDIRNLALEIYEETSDKNPYPPINIKLWTDYEVDWSIVSEWAKFNLPTMMILDRKAFMNYLKNVEAMPPGVEKKMTPKASIKSDLSEYLKEE